MEMTWPELRDHVRQALSDLNRCDPALLELRANERSVTHKLAEYLRRSLDRYLKQGPEKPGKLSIDCEYNRFGDNGRPKYLPWDQEEPIEDGGAYYTPNPDIIFHERTQQDSNVLAIEVKTYYNAYASVVLLDKMKLTGYLRVPTFYQNGLYLNLGFDGKQILLSEALLVERSRLEKVDEGSLVDLWLTGKNLLVKPDTKTRRPGFLAPTKEMDNAASKLMKDFERTFCFVSVLDEIRW